MKKILAVICFVIIFLVVSVVDASRCRVYYHQGGKISVDFPDLRLHKKPSNMTMDEWIDSQFIDSANSKPNLHINGDLSRPPLPFAEIDTSQLPQDRKDRDRWRGSIGQGISIDITVVLRKDLFKQIDDELLKPSPDVTVIERIRRKIEKGEHD